MKITAQDTAILAGIGAVSAGTAMQFGTPLALIVGGALVIALTILSLIVR